MSIKKSNIKLNDTNLYITDLEICCQECIVYNNNNVFIISANQVYYPLYIQYFHQGICWTFNPNHLQKKTFINSYRKNVGCLTYFAIWYNFYTNLLLKLTHFQYLNLTLPITKLRCNKIKKMHLFIHIQLSVW